MADDSGPGLDADLAVVDGDVPRLVAVGAVGDVLLHDQGDVGGGRGEAGALGRRPVEVGEPLGAEEVGHGRTVEDGLACRGGRRGPLRGHAGTSHRGPPE